MKQVFNWTIGSFFRTIGRIAAFLIVGGFIAYLLAHSNIDWGIKDLFFEKVDALSLDGTLQSETQIFTQNRILDIHNYSASSNNIGETNQFFDINYTNTNGYEYMVIPYALTTTQNYTTYGDVDGYSYDVFNSMVLRITLRTSAGPWAPCEIQNNMIVCKLNEGYTYTAIVINFVDPVNPNYSVYWNYIYIHNFAQLWNSNARETTNAINNQTQVLQDSNTTSESSQATNYVNNYQDDTPTGLTAAVTAPLNIMNNLVLGNSSPLCFTLNSKQTCFPDGSLVWGNNHTQNKWFKSGLSDPKGAFVILFNLVVGGFLCYKMLISMLRIWNNMLDPTNTKIEVMKL